VTIHADASLYAGLFGAGESLQRALDPQRKAYVQVVRGSVTVNGQPLQAGDALRCEHEAQLRIDDGVDAEVLVFDLH
jgi:redox-sensitive bicupin YhaK (pirin superfamily)